MKFFLLFLCVSLFVYSDETGVVVDLKNPLFQDGVLSTTQGGIVTAPNFRLQASSITYIKSKTEHRIEAEGCLMLEGGDYLFVGDSLKYDFLTSSGAIFNGRTVQDPWFIGGDTIELLSDGTYLITEAYLTTSETLPPDWQINAGTVTLDKKRQLNAKDLYARIFNLNLLWFPSLKVDLSSLTDTPIRFSARWGGKQGGRLGVVYNLMNWGRFKTYVRLDYRLNRGPGGGLETYYVSEDHKESLETINYVSRDSSLEQNSTERFRYRFQGIYQNMIFNDSFSVLATWDKLSDKDMATDYNDQGLELDTAGRTELNIRKQEETLITNFRTRLRVNQFQTVKQELPTLLITKKPISIERTGFIWENSLETSYLDFAYANDLKRVTDYNSTRIDYITRIYRPIQINTLKITPEVGTTLLFYGNSPEHNAKFLAVGYTGVNSQMSFHRTGAFFKHVITPYANWQYLTCPSVNPDKHYIFDIEDGIWRINSVRLGIKNDFIQKNTFLKRLVEIDLYNYMFVDSAPIPKVLCDITTRTWPNVKHMITTGYDLRQHSFDHFNLRNEWTVSRNIALALEYRSRSKYCYRKAVQDNYILESFRSQKALLHSSVSDKRDTLLFHAFVRFHPLYALEFESRSGWNRRFEPDYSEYEVDFLAQLKSHWLVKLSYQHNEEEDRVAIYITLLPQLPKESSCILRPLEF